MTGSTAPTFGLWYDLRNPPQWPQPLGSLYRETVDQAVWAESLGFGSAWVSERRAARLGAGVITLVNDHCAWHMDAIAEYGRDPAEARIYASQWSIVADDPERVWSRISEHVRYQRNASSTSLTRSSRALLRS